MPYYQLEEAANGEVLLYDEDGQELARFVGREAFQQALRWAETQGLTLMTNVNPAELWDQNRYYLRRRPRFLRFFRQNALPQPSDPPNVRRIIIPENLDNLLREDDLPPYLEDDIVLAPEEDDPEDG